MSAHPELKVPDPYTLLPSCPAPFLLLNLRGKYPRLKYAGSNTYPILNYIVFIGAVGLTIVAVIPIFFNGIFNANVSFGGTSIIIIVGVIIETLKQIESQMLVLLRIAPIGLGQTVKDFTSDACAVPFSHNRCNYHWKLHNGLRKDNRNYARRVDFQRNMAGLTAHLFSSLNFLTVLQ